MILKKSQVLVLAVIGSLLSTAFGLPTHQSGLNNEQDLGLQKRDELLKRDPMLSSSGFRKLSKPAGHQSPASVTATHRPQFTFYEWDIGLTMSSRRYIEALEDWIPGKREQMYKDLASNMEKELGRLQGKREYKKLKEGFFKTLLKDPSEVSKVDEPNTEQWEWLAQKQEGIFEATLKDYGVQFVRPPNSNLRSSN